jgi:beta-N-acetylhexosaminidase
LGKKYNPGIHIRSFGQDPDVVAKMGCAFICGQQGHGVAACAKHFPGKGAARQDAHLSLPLISESRRTLLRTHLAPFQAAIRAGAACVMSSHAVYPALDRSKAPATFSKPIILGLLRRRLGFKGVAISDDLCMGAVTRSRAVPEAALEAFLAGHDLLIVAHIPEAMLETAELLLAAAADGRIPAGRWEESMARLAALSRSFHPARASVPKLENGLALRIARKAVEVLQKGAVPIPLPLRGRRLAVVWPDLREVRERFTFEGGPEAPYRRLKAHIAGWPAKASFTLTPVVSEASVEPAVRAAKKAGIALFFCFEAMRFPGQKRALDSLQMSEADKLVVCFLRNPWDKELLAPRVSALHAYGYRDCQIKALLEVLRR